jgi:hypothetical protein
MVRVPQVQVADAKCGARGQCVMDRCRACPKGLLEDTPASLTVEASGLLDTRRRSEVDLLGKPYPSNDFDPCPVRPRDHASCLCVCACARCRCRACARGYDRGYDCARDPVARAWTPQVEPGMADGDVISFEEAADEAPGADVRPGDVEVTQNTKPTAMPSSMQLPPYCTRTLSSHHSCHWELAQLTTMI